jgi:hypothetical protein
VGKENTVSSAYWVFENFGPHQLFFIGKISPKKEFHNSEMK